MGNFDSIIKFLGKEEAYPPEQIEKGLDTMDETYDNLNDIPEDNLANVDNLLNMFGAGPTSNEQKTPVETGKASESSNIKKDSLEAEIINVEETPQNKFFARQNRLMKGSVIETSLGKARITNRPSQEGMINGILIE